MGCGSSSQKPVARKGYQAKNEANGQAGTTTNDTVGSETVLSTDGKETSNHGTTSNSQVNLQVESGAQNAVPPTESGQNEKQTETKSRKPSRSAAPPVQQGHTLATYSSRNTRLSNDRAKRNLAAHTSRNETVASDYGKRKLSKYSTRNEQMASPRVKKDKEPDTMGDTSADAAQPPEEPANEQHTNERDTSRQQSNGQQTNGKPGNGRARKNAIGHDNRSNNRAKQNLAVPNAGNQTVSSGNGKRYTSQRSYRNEQVASRGKKDDELDGGKSTSTYKQGNTRKREPKQIPPRHKHVTIPIGRDDDPGVSGDTTDTARAPEEPKQNGQFELSSGHSKRKKILAESSERLKRMEEESDSEPKSPQNAPKSNESVDSEASPEQSDQTTDRNGRPDRTPEADKSMSSPRRSVRISNRVGPSKSSDRGTSSTNADTHPMPKKAKTHVHQETGRKRKREKQQQTPRSDDPNERAQLRRIRQMLRDATFGNDVYDLDEAIWHFEKQGLEDNGDLTAALERLDYLQLRLALREAILRRHLGTLDRAIDDAINSDHQGKLKNSIRRAEELRDHLRALDRYSHDILDMDQKAISEIRSYCNPPPSVHEVMAACYMLLGTREDRLLEWPEIQSYTSRLGRDSLRKMIRNFDTDSVPIEVQLRVKEIINSYNLEEIRGVSNGVATFYIWAKNMIDLLDKRALQESGDDTDRSALAVKKG